jgi:hypothetical protein
MSQPGFNTESPRELGQGERREVAVTFAREIVFLCKTDEIR